jgi:hypothetical protein
MAETENYKRMTVEEAMARYDFDRDRAEMIIRLAYPLPVRIRPPKVVAIGRELSAAGLRERIAREVNELIAKEGDRPDLSWHRTMARVHEARAK